ncbi:DUF1289 domain-containing protein [Alphaproteobacteria bacterium LSUCC0684]
MTTNTKLPSPCISICQINPVDGRCLGCDRTRDEIAAWPRLTPDQQMYLLAELRERRAARTGRRRRSTRRVSSNG